MISSSKYLFYFDKPKDSLFFDGQIALGNYYIIAVADYDNEFRESSETNNKSYYAMQMVDKLFFPIQTGNGFGTMSQLYHTCGGTLHYDGKNL